MFKTFYTLKTYIYFRLLIILKNKNKHFYSWNLNLLFYYLLFFFKIINFIIKRSLNSVN